MAHKIGYARVSTVGQKLSVQRDLLKKEGCNSIFEEHASGSNMERPELTILLRTIRKGDVIVITKLDRLARSIVDFWNIYNQIKDRSAALHILNMGLDTNSNQGRLMMGILASVAEFERELIKERQAEGIAKAKAQGKHLGRPKLNGDLRQKALAMIKNGDTKATIAETLKIGESTVYKIQREHNQNITT